MKYKLLTFLGTTKYTTAYFEWENKEEDVVCRTGDPYPFVQMGILEFLVAHRYIIKGVQGLKPVTKRKMLKVEESRVKYPVHSGDTEENKRFEKTNL